MPSDSTLKELFTFLKDVSTLERLSHPKKKVSKQTQLKRLKNSYLNQRLVLVLGSGVSKVYGLPDWNTLLQKLLIKSLESEPEISESNTKEIATLLTNLFSPSPLILARIIQQRADNSLFQFFESDVRDILYEEIDDIEINPLFKEIRQFCIAPGKSPNLDSIITFNYDDTLESCLSHLEVEIPFKSIYNDGMQSKAGELPIYHVHGFLPRKDSKEELDSSNQITLSEDIYHQHYADVYCWSNIVQINKYTNNTCLFIGTSFTDPNLRRLLDVAKKHREENLAPHYIFKQRYNKQEVKDKIEQKIKDDLSKKTSSVSEEITNSAEEYDNKIEKLAQDLIGIMERFEEEDAFSFGVNIIWYDNYDEIPINLRKIRNS